MREFFYGGRVPIAVKRVIGSLRALGARAPFRSRMPIASDEPPDPDDPWRSNPDIRLLDAVRRGNEAALVELISRYREQVFRFSYRYFGAEAKATRITEDTFVMVYHTAGNFCPPPCVGTWILSVAVELCRQEASAALEYNDATGKGKLMRETLLTNQKKSTAINVCSIIIPATAATCRKSKSNVGERENR